MLSIKKSEFAAVLNPSTDIPTDLKIDVHEDENKVTVFHAHKYYLALVSKVFRRRFFGSLRETSEIIDVRGTTAQAFETMINFVYHRKCKIKFKSVKGIVDIANLAEMYDVKGLMVGVEKAVNRIQMNLKNVVLVASAAKKLSIFSSFNQAEHLLAECCVFLHEKLRTHVIDFSGLGFSRKYPETVKFLHNLVLLLPLSACQMCEEFVIDENHHDCPREQWHSEDDGHLQSYDVNGDE